MNNAEMVPTPKKGTIIRFGDFGLTVIGIYVGRSDDNGYMVVVLQHNATPPGTLKTYKEVLLIMYIYMLDTILQL